MQHTVSEILHHDVSAYSLELRESSELLKRARSGLVNGTTVLRYLDGIRYLTEQSVRLLELAAESSEGRQLPDLAKHYREKLAEETGHHLWAERDMRGIASAFGVAARSEPSRALEGLIAFLEREIVEAPWRFLAYTLLAEHVTVAVGPDWVAALERACGVSRAHLSVVDNHVELDRDHVDEGLAELARLAPVAELDAMRETIRVAIGYLDGFAAELLQFVEAA
jgi:hypothetical protein